MKNIIILLLLALGMSGCHRVSLNEKLSEAQDALQLSKIETARSLANDILINDSSRMTASEYGELSIIYMQIDDMTGSSDVSDMEHAVLCCRRAISRDVDEAREYYSKVAPEFDRHVMTITSIVKNLDIPDAEQVGPDWIPPTDFTDEEGQDE